MNLSVEVVGLTKAINAIKRYQNQTLPKKAELLKRRVAEELGLMASLGFSASAVDDVIKGKNGSSMRAAQVEVTVGKEGSVLCVVAHGEDAVFVEFGSGIHHNAGTVHPNSAELGFTVGSYGKGQGNKDTWGFIGDDGEVHLSHGTPAQMPMYNAKIQVMRMIADLAREVFG